MLPENLVDALACYKEHLRASNSIKKAKEIFDQTHTAIYRYTLPGWGHPAFHGRKPTRAESAAAYEFAQTIALEKLENGLAAIECGFDLLKASSSSRYTYSSKLKAFVGWVKESWGTDNKGSKLRNRCPKFNHGYGQSSNKKVTSRITLPSYGLNSKLVTIWLQSEIEELHKFSTQPRYPGRNFDPLKPIVIKERIKTIYRIFGWFVTYKQVAVEDLSLDLLVPVANLRSGKSKKKEQDKAEKAAQFIDEWVCAHLDFLEFERKCQSWQTLLKIIICVETLIRFQYRNEHNHPQYNDVPAMEKMREHARKLNKRSATHKPISNEELKWLDLPDIFTKIVSPLRQECNHRGFDGMLRSDTAIAQSFQSFLIWGCLTFRPPRRQHEFRDLKIAMSCPIQKPSRLSTDQLIHPLPLNRSDDRFNGYLFKDFDSLWYMDMTPESYKTGKTYGHQKLLIPNPLFEDGKTFYNYLEAFLYGYYCNREGDWISGETFSSTFVGKSRYISLRMAFNPEHNYVFSEKSGGKFDTNSFHSVVMDSAHRLTGQLVTPHLLRNIYATYFLDQGYDQALIESLAYAMAHSVEQLRKQYDRRRPKQKHRPIEEMMTTIAQQLTS